MSSDQWDRDDIVMLQIPCAKEIYTRLCAGLPVFSIRLEDNGDGTHALIVRGINGPFADPFADSAAPGKERA